MSKYLGIKSGNEGFKDLNANESYKNIDKKIIDILKDRVDTINFNLYPDTFSKKLSNLYANYVGVNSDNIIIGNGSDEILGTIFSLVVSKNKKVVTFSKDFLMYDYYCEINEGELYKYELDLSKKFNVKEFIAYIKEIDPDLVIFSNPNNPTGLVIKKEEVLEIIGSFKEKLFIIDEAYAEFENESVVSYIDKYKNLIVTRTLSKAFGLASLRVGIMLANKTTIDFYKENKVPYTVNSLSQLTAEIVLENREDFIPTIKYIKDERDRMFDIMENFSLENTNVYKSGGNFLYGESKKLKELLDVFEKNKINIRSFNDNSFRVTVADRKTNDIVIDIIKSVG